LEVANIFKKFHSYKTDHVTRICVQPTPLCVQPPACFLDQA
jgi:hypothetical protein